MRASVIFVYDDDDTWESPTTTKKTRNRIKGLKEIQIKNSRVDDYPTRIFIKNLATEYYITYSRYLYKLVILLLCE